MVVGARPISETEHFSWIKKKLQRLGSWAVRVASKTDVMDAPSGFRAISRETALRLNVFNQYTYTLETIIQAGLSNLRVLSVPIRTNGDLRPSRLVRSISSYVRRSLITIMRVFVVYRPIVFFMASASVLCLLGLTLGLRYLWFMMAGEGAGHMQSLLLATIAITLGGLLAVLGVVADLIAINRRLLEQINVRTSRLELGLARRQDLIN